MGRMMNWRVLRVKKKTSRKKGNKGSGILFCASAFDTIPNDNTGDEIDKGEDNEDDDEPVIFKGKKKSSKHSTKGGSEFSAARVDELHGVKGNDVWKEEKKNAKDDEGDEPITAALLDEDRDTTLITVSAKKKGISFYAGLSPEAEVEGENVHTGETEQLNMADSKVEPVHNIVNRTQKVAETLKNKKKKKSGRTAQEEVELGKILAELGEGPPTLEASDLPTQEEKVRILAESVLSEDVAGEKECEEEMVESALAKKKKKKQKEKEKEKEKEEKAAAAEGMKEKQEEVKAETTEPKRSGAKGKAVDKKVLNCVRGMQEALARRKEAEERKKREEEERLRKEEEERRRQEELERLAEEARQRKKEREKEKLLKKKLEGKHITAKQKEAARCLEARRNQILASAGVPLHSADNEGAPSKRPNPSIRQRSLNLLISMLMVLPLLVERQIWRKRKNRKT